MFGTIISKWCLLAHFEPTLDFSHSEFTCHNNISQICNLGQISLRNSALNSSCSDNMTPLGVLFLLLRVVHLMHAKKIPKEGIYY